MSDPFFFDKKKAEKKLEQKMKEEKKPLESVKVPSKLPKIEVKVPPPEKIPKSIKSFSKKFPGYSKTQETIGTIFYVIFVVASLVSIGGTVYTIADFISPTGKMEAFLALSLGLKIAIIGGFLAGLFFLLIFFFGLFKKGRKTLLKIIFKRKELEDQYKNRIDVKLIAIGLLLSLIAILVGIIFAIFQDLLMGPEESPFSLTSLLQTYSGGQIVLFTGMGIFIIFGIAIFIIYFWRNGYYLILKLFGGLEQGE